MSEKRNAGEPSTEPNTTNFQYRLATPCLNPKPVTRNPNPTNINQQPQIPPAAVEVEESVLGSCLLEQAALEATMDRARQEWFYKPANEKIFAAMKTLYTNNKAVDALSVEAKIRDQGHIEFIGGATYIYDLNRSVSSAANIDYYLQIIEEKYLKRVVITKFGELIKDAYEGESDPFKILEESAAFTDNILIKGTFSEGQSMYDALPEALSSIETAYDNYQKGIKFTGLPTGLGIDEYTSGYQKGDLIILAGRPSMGKTALALNHMHYLALNANPDYRTGSAIFSMEMSRSQLVKRFLALESGTEQDFIRGGKLKPEELKTLMTKTAQRLAAGNIMIDDTPALTLASLRSRARKYVKKHGVGLLVVDYLQLMDGSGGKYSNRELEIATISRGLKGIARELNVPVIALSQLSRAVEVRGGLKKPQLADLRESGSIEQDADVVIFLWRPEYYEIEEYNNQNTKSLAYALISKQRNGPTGEAKMQFHKETGRFRKPAPGYQNNGDIYSKAAANQNAYNLDDEPKF